ncbi:MAG: hypothetical protein GH151_00915 [Bacteroidetes bacterium]|nr:hypothetical protein [Bacteroidota bacterium]
MVKKYVLEDNEDPMRTLCRMASRTESEDFPEDVIGIAKRLLLDTVVVTLGGSGQEGVKADWVSVTETWRTKALGMALNARTRELPGGNMDGVHRQILDIVLNELGVQGFFGSDKDEMTLFWHRIPPWPDAPNGHARLKNKYILSTITILSLAMITGISRIAPFHWDCVISCEMLDNYKFHHSVYRRSAEHLDINRNR